MRMRMSPHSWLIGGSLFVGSERRDVWEWCWCGSDGCAVCVFRSAIVCVKIYSLGVTVGDDFQMGRERALWMMFWDVPRRNVSYFGFEFWSLHCCHEYRKCFGAGGQGRC